MIHPMSSSNVTSLVTIISSLGWPRPLPRPKTCKSRQTIITAVKNNKSFSAHEDLVTELAGAGERAGTAVSSGVQPPAQAAGPALDRPVTQSGVSHLETRNQRNITNMRYWSTTKSSINQNKFQNRENLDSGCHNIRYYVFQSSLDSYCLFVCP